MNNIQISPLQKQALADSLRLAFRQLRQSMAACEIMVKDYLKNNPEFLKNIQKLNEMRGGFK